MFARQREGRFLRLRSLGSAKEISGSRVSVRIFHFMFSRVSAKESLFISALVRAKGISQFVCSRASANQAFLDSRASASEFFKNIFLCTYVHAPAQKDLNSYIARQLEIFLFFHTCASARKKRFISEYFRAPARAYSSCPCSRVSAKPKILIPTFRAPARRFF